MKNKRLFSFLLLVVALIALVGCSRHEMSDLWESYVKAVNAKDINAIAGTFYEADSKEYNAFVEANNYAITSIETESFEVVMDCDFSNKLNSQGYYKADVKAKVNGTSQEFSAYALKNNRGMYFTTPIELVENKISHEPNQLWLSQVYYTTESFNYSYALDTREATVLRQVSNEKNVVIPTTFKDLEGNDVNVTSISKYAFYKYGKVLCFTTATSKLETVEVPEGISLIDEYAFFQCVNLKSFKVPTSVNTIKEMAFTGCTDMEVFEILRTTEEFEAVKAESKSSGETDKPVVIDNARTMQQGEIMTLTTTKYDDDAVRVIKWSSSSTNVSVNADTGEIKAINTGEATIKAELRDNPSIYAEVKINIISVNESISIAANSLNRCNSLSELKIYATNPNSIKITNGTVLNLNDKVKIIVPKGSKAMYQTHETWSKFSSQIIEME